MKQSWIKHAGIFLVLLSLLLNPFFVTPVHALSAPTQVAPGHGVTTTAANTPPHAVPEFRWSAVSGAKTYRLQVSRDIAFTSLVVNITTANTSHTPTSTGNFSDGVYYWRVRVESPAPVSAYSGIRSFTKQWAAPGHAPTLISPANLATLSFYDQPMFAWSSVVGAAKYKFQIYSSPGGWSSLAYSTTTQATTHVPGAKLSNGNYYWRVVPVDAAGRDGTPSVERSFTAGYNFVPTLLEPEDGANPVFTPTLRWTAVRGAQFYRLQYSTDPSFGTGVTTVTTRNTSHTPVSTIGNDVNYYWRVSAQSGNSISDWSPVRQFIKKWYIQPVLLTPTNNYQEVRFPLFSWTPVPGASYYKVEISKQIGFSPIYESGDTANTFYTPKKFEAGTFYWRVTPYDGNGKAGQASGTFSFVSNPNSLAPHQVYPLYYYTPDTYTFFPGITTKPHEDRTASLPIFMWHRVLLQAGDANRGEVYPEAYRLQVSTKATFSPIVWTVDTENLSATPTSANPFTPAANTDYYWRVRPLVGGVEVGAWSQIWRARFDLSQGLAPTDAPTLIRPTNGFELVETTPLLEWFPINGATAYDVEISRDSGFSEIVDAARVPYPAYSPTQSLAQRNLGDLDFGVYYWRVRRAPNGAWSETRRFQIAAQSQWKYARILGDASNRLQIGSDPGGDVVPDFDLTSLQVSQSSDSWYFGFHVPATPTQNVTYGIYLDLDHQEGSGATFDPDGYSVTTISAYQPEYAIYVLQDAGVFDASRSYLYRWNGGGWDSPQLLDSIGGQIYFDGSYVEVQLKNTSIGYQDTTGSYAISLMSFPMAGGSPQDTVPSDPGVPGGNLISRFANVTERMNLLMPPNDAGIDPSTFPSILPFFWDWPIRAPFSGAIMKAYLDPQFTSEAATYTSTSNTAYYAPSSQSWEDDFSGDNTYYWRVRPRYRDGDCGSNLCNGAWSQGARFERQGFVPQDLKTSVSFATPTFSWSQVEGAEYYNLQIDNDPGFGSPDININTRQNTYTHENTLGNGTYYWRVRVHRRGGVINNWTQPLSFTIALPTPTGLTHKPSGVVAKAPTLCWTPLLANSSTGDPVLAAWKYRVQVSKDATFSSIFDTVDTEQSCWTPIKGYDDGQYFWRVAIMDGQNKLGNYSSAQKFTKQYPVTSLVSPASGATITATPTFVWTPVHGAAKYKLEVSKYPTFSPLYDSVTTDSVRWTPIKAYELTTYYWRVAMVDSAGKVGPFVGATIILQDNTQNPGPIFADVSASYWARSYIERLYNARITGGCTTTPLKYCPEESVNRAQMAVFLLKGIHGPSYSPPAVGSSTGFSDVPTSHWAAAWIKQLAAERITGGCGAGKFCPDGIVTRDQMAVFLLKAKHGTSYSPPGIGGSGTGFVDVPPTHWAAAWIKQLAAEGITGGCAAGKFCPGMGVNRAQMAVFLVKAFNLP